MYTDEYQLIITFKFTDNNLMEFHWMCSQIQNKKLKPTILFYIFLCSA